MSELQLIDISATSKKFEFVVSASEIQQACISQLQQMQKGTRIKGFRPGKAPMSLIRQKYGESVLAKVAQKIANKKLQTALQQHQISPVKVSGIDRMPEREDQDWNFGITLDFVPPFDLPDLTKISATLIKAEVQDSDVDATLEQMRQNHATYKEIDQPVASGGYVEADLVYQVLDKGKKAPGLSADSFATIEKSAFSGSIHKQRWHIDTESLPFKGMEKALIGMNKGESKNTHFAITKDFQNTQWRGKTMHAFIQVNAVLEQTLPKIDDDFARRLQIDKDVHNTPSTGLVALLREKVQADLHARLTARLEEANKGRMFAALNDATSVEIPQSLVDSRSVGLRRDLASRYLSPEKLRNEPHPENLFPADMFAARASYQAKLGQVFSRLVKDKQIQVTRDEVLTIIQESSGEYDEKEKYLQMVLQDQQQMRMFSEIALERKVYTWLLDRCTVEWQEMCMEDVFAGKAGLSPDSGGHLEGKQTTPANT